MSNEFKATDWKQERVYAKLYEALALVLKTLQDGARLNKFRIELVAPNWGQRLDEMMHKLEAALNEASK